MFRGSFTILIFAYVLSTEAHGDVTTTFDAAQWQSVVDDYSTINFTDFPSATLIADQYAIVGVSFTGPAFISDPTPLYAVDGWGLHGPSGLHLLFDQPQSWIAIDHAGNAYFELFSKGQLVGVSGFDSLGGIGSFLGVVSTIRFDEVIITKPPDFGTHIFVDDLHWGAPVPAPGALIVCLLGALGISRRRRARW